MRRIILVGIGAALLLTAWLTLSPKMLSEEESPKTAVSQPSTQKPPGLAKRIPWTTSRLTGSPDPPPPYKTVRAFPKLTFTNPLHLSMAPGSDRFFVCEQAGKIFSFPNRQDVAKADLFFDVTAQLGPTWDKKTIRSLDTLYALAFHPQFKKNRYCYIAYVVNGAGRDQFAEGSRVSRFEVSDTDPPICDPKSEKIIITWLGGGHNGCDIHFGPDGFLYISTGDGSGPNPPDKLDTGQDISDLLSSLLRIDVDNPDSQKNYGVPKDNPFIKTPGARPEIWAYGFRNPWRMSFDRQTGDLWVADVGWEQWESIYRVQKGGNYGWSFMEGPQLVRPNSRRGPTPILPPTQAMPHTESASITGGYVYRGKKFKELAGAYIFGDWVTRKVWATRFDGDKIVWHKELARGNERVVAFGEDQDKELYFVHHEDIGTIHRLEPNEAVKDFRADFPRKLSETGLFASVKDHVPAAGVIPFSVNAEGWIDHATAERFLALPGTSTAKLYDEPIPIPGGFFSGQVFLPKDGVLAKTISLEMERGNPKSRRRLETQILHFDGTAWQGYTYAWNDEQTDAVLVPAKGEEKSFMVVDTQTPGGKRKQRWHLPSRTECSTCHNPWTGYALAFNLLQINRDHDFGGGGENQLRALERVGLVSFHHRDNGKEQSRKVDELPAQKLVDPYSPAADLHERGRSYLHVNCSHCHQFGAGGTADLDMRYSPSFFRGKFVDVAPVQGTFDIVGAKILAPGDPYRSVLYYRMAKLGPGRMPHLGSDIIDERGLSLIHDWIRQFPIRREERALIDKLKSLDAKNEGERARAIGQLLANTSSAMMLASAVAENQLAEPVRGKVLKAALASSNSLVRDLFERFVPDDQRVKRLGSVVRAEDILALKGSSEKGKELFFKSGGLQCSSCHKIQGAGGNLGPDLSDVGKRLSRGQIIESILEPSKSIDPKYVAYLVETADGKLLTGLLVNKTNQELVLRVVGDKEVRLPAAAVASVTPQQKSLMPELLLRDATAEQAADLLEFLAGLK